MKRHKTQARRIIDDARRQGDANFEQADARATGATRSSPTGKRPRSRLARNNGLGQAAGQPQPAAGVPARQLAQRPVCRSGRGASAAYTGPPRAYAQRLADAAGRRRARRPFRSEGHRAACARADESTQGLLRARVEEGRALADIDRGRFHPSAAASSWNHRPCACTTRRWIAAAAAEQRRLFHAPRAACGWSDARRAHPGAQARKRSLSRCRKSRFFKRFFRTTWN